MSPQRTTLPAPETIGGYTVHPVASLFPLLEGKEYEDLKKSITDHGQQAPIIIQGNMLIDGHNRLKVLLDLGRQPSVHKYNSPLPVEQFILVANLFRRHLTDDQRIMITTQVMLPAQTETAHARQQEGGKKHGRGRPKVTQDSEQPIPDRNAQSTAGQIAAAAKGSRHQAEQAIAVTKHAPELVEKVKTGAMPLKNAAAAASRAKAATTPPRTPRREDSYLDDKTRVVSTVNRAMQRYPGKRSDLKAAITKAMESYPARPDDERPFPVVH